MYLNGLSTPKDTKQAIEYFTQSAKSGVAKAQLSLGIIYLEGTLLEQDLARAAKWIQKSRVQGKAQAESIWNKYELWKYWQVESSANQLNNINALLIRAYYYSHSVYL